MARKRTELLAFNRGIVSQLALARTDVKRVQMSAEIQRNFLPRVLGPMSLRPGFQYIVETDSDQVSYNLPFIFSITDTAILQMTDQSMRVLVDDAFITRGSVSTAFSNGTFGTNLTGWADSDEAGGTSAWVTGGYMGLLSNGTGAAVREQTLTVAGADQNVEHAVRVVVEQGVVTLRIGTTSGDDDILPEVTLTKGTHSLAFTPTGASAYVRLASKTTYTSLVDSIAIEAAGVMEVPTPWTEDVLQNIRFEQSGDVVWIACGPSIRQIRIERRAVNSWSVVDYVADYGPLRPINLSTTTITPSALTGDITLTASANLFTPENVGGLIAVDSVGQSVSASITAANNFTNEIRVTGIGEGRRFGLTITGLTGTGSSVTLQRSVGAPGAWVDVTSYTTNQTTTYLDALDNQIIYYRIGVATGDYSSGTIVASLQYTAGSIRGVARVTVYTSPTVVSAIVLKDFGATSASPDWYEGAWSPRRGYPTAVALYEGRLAWAGRDKIDFSVSDDFGNYSDEVEGDAGPIGRSIGAGPVDTINWLLPAQLLLMGGQGAEFICRSSTLGEPLTPTNFNLKEATTRGSLRVAAVKVDTSAVFVDRSGSRIYELEFDAVSYNFNPNDLTSVVPEIASAGVRRIGVSRRPDTRLVFVLDDGTALMLVYDKTEDVRAWVTITSPGAGGLIEDVVVLPGTLEDRIYFQVKRTIAGVTRRYFEKMALQTECEGGAISKLADSFIVYDSTPTSTITGLDHLEGEEVVVWADGLDLGTRNVASGSISLQGEYSQVVVGLTYTGQYKAAKIGMLGMIRRLTRLSLVLYKTHAQGLQYGRSFDELDPMPLYEDGQAVDQDAIWDNYEQESFELSGIHANDERLHLQAQAPRPCTVLAAILEMEEDEPSS